jgi:hypothetical protein
MMIIITSTHPLSGARQIQLSQRFLQPHQTGHLVLQRQRAQTTHRKRTGRRILGHIGEHTFNLRLHTVADLFATALQFIASTAAVHVEQQP